ncbi:hypothetical protein GCM10025868_39390 [Angustibacter aerolatus]|uniref:Uncharacterized protein n=1 Tax=Angustibacter aerolatus TaxID=1162965 RepID=A0ABQ6JMX7_9ACTN|nr:hypothetical protein [Angustibacter aerolatus]GMA88689.1 hypothetical protein GCM10025868_39390 [Angustibacter aerolatus]
MAGLRRPRGADRSITNGVHAPTWVDRRLLELVREHGGGELADDPRAWDAVGRIPADRVWAARREMREQARRGGSPSGARVVAPPRRELGRAWAGSTRCSTPTC